MDRLTDQRTDTTSSKCARLHIKSPILCNNNSKAGGLHRKSGVLQDGKCAIESRLVRIGEDVQRNPRQVGDNLRRGNRQTQDGPESGKNRKGIAANQGENDSEIIFATDRETMD